MSGGYTGRFNSSTTHQMPYRKRILICLNCYEQYQGTDPKQKYCSHRCAGFHNNWMKKYGKGKKLTKKQKEKLSNSLKLYYSNLESHPFKNSDEWSKKIGKATKGKYKKKAPLNIFEVSTRTRSKILSRLNLKCSCCGYDKCPGKLHHIKGKKINDFDNHSNLSFVCARCHDEIHYGLIKKSSLITLKDLIGDRWLEYYYG